MAVLARIWFGYGGAAPPEALQPGVYTVRRVVDGDTLLLANEARVRLIGVDTPEIAGPNHPAPQPWSRQASDFTRRFLAGGAVRLSFDRERVDRYGRFLAYVWVDDRLLNEELLLAGLARARLNFHFGEAMKRRFRQAEGQAKAERVGLWSP